MENIKRDSLGRFLPNQEINYPRNWTEIANKLKGQKRTSEQIKRISEGVRKAIANRTPEQMEVERQRRKKIGIYVRSLNRKGPNHPSWRGGRYIGKDGYVRILMREHPNANKDGYVLEHRIIMEKTINRYLNRNEEVHHKNGIKSDNRPENLEVLIKKMHEGKVVCPYCTKEFLVK
jgi:hypothetical protein